MALTPGACVGVYEVTAQIGEGGMGQVYRARDTMLNREVALKVLPDSFASDPERLARFTREAQILASLNHANIAHIHGLEESGGVRALVMELVEGEDLSQRIARGTIPIDEVLPIAKQIADALEAAHEQGIVHRDLKPANIKVRADGTVKVLDFGLAKAMEASSASVGVTNSATITSPAPTTSAGVILGTAAYMAPEQARGRAADKRSDVWAFGCVLYEMLTGRRPFDGEDVTDTIAAVMRGEPHWNALPTQTPAAIRRLLRRCLAKDRSRRLADIADARLELEDGGHAPTVGETNEPRADRSRRLALAVGGWIAAFVLAVFAATLYLGRAGTELATWRMDIVTPSATDSSSFALSSNGRKLAFVANQGGQRLWVRALDEIAAQPIPGTDGASFPFWAPDGRAIGFFADGKVKRIDLVGGTPQVLSDAIAARGGAWNERGDIVFASFTLGGLMHVAAGGGVPESVTQLLPGQDYHRWPQFLPDGHRFLFFAEGSSDVRGIYLGSLDGTAPKRVAAAEAAGMFAAPHWLLLMRQNLLVALRFDPAQGVTSGDAVLLAQGIGLDVALQRAAFSVSAGVLAHRAGGAVRRQLVWTDRSGAALSQLGTPDENALASPELAPDGRQVAVHRSLGKNDLWLLDIGRSVWRRFTFDTNTNITPVWSADGRAVVFASIRNQKGIFDVFVKPVSGAGEEQVLLTSSEHKYPLDCSPDGRTLLYETATAKSGADLWAVPLVGEHTPVPVLETRFDEAAGQFSPDGRWIAYQSNASGRSEIYVRPFPGPDGQWQVSTSGGSQPRWRHDGKELFYIAPDERLMAVPIALAADGQTIEAETPVVLFATRLASGANIVAGPFARAQYAVASDGRFLMNVRVDEPTAPPITVVLNWDAALKR